MLFLLWAVYLRKGELRIGERETGRDEREGVLSRVWFWEFSFRVCYEDLGWGVLFSLFFLVLLELL